MAISKEQFLEVANMIRQKPFATRNIAVDKSNTITYLLYRFKRPLLKWRFNTYQKKNAHKPWLTPDAIEALEALLKKTDVGLEYGSGRSTKFFAERLNHLTSVEHHEGWFEQVNQELKIEGFENVEYILKTPNNQVPKVYFTSEAQHFTPENKYPIEDNYFKDYIGIIDNYSDEHFDFVLIDGRARKSCALAVTSKIKSGGLLVLDNAERVRYKQIHKSLKGWQQIYTTTGLTDTIIWRKP